MTSPDDRHDKVDPEHARPEHARPEHVGDGNPFDQPDHRTGEEYDIGRERAEGRVYPSGQEDRVAAGGDPATPAEGDNRASFDPATGEVRSIRLPEDGGLPSA